MSNFIAPPSSSVNRDMTDRQWVGWLLSNWLKRNGVGIMEFAARLGISNVTVRYILRGERLPSFETLGYIHAVTGIPYDAFFRAGKFATAWKAMMRK